MCATRRDALIIRLALDGVPHRTIAEACGLSHVYVGKLARKAATEGR